MPIHRIRSLLVTALLLAVCASGCDDPSADVVHCPAPRAAPTAEVIDVAQGNREFAWDLFGQLRQEQQGNLFFSPYSISTALGMTYAGARGTTETQMAEVLHFHLPQDRLHLALGALSDDLGASDKVQGYELSIANRLWATEGMEFLPAYLSITREQYGAELTRLDFASDSEKARKTINRWVEGQTNDRIKDLLKPDTIQPTTVLVLTNAIYFKGDWALQFDPEYTQTAPFHISSEETVDAPLMSQSGEFRIADTEQVSLLELPYIGEDLAMLVVLPKKADGLAEVESLLSADQLAEWEKKLHREEVDVWLPKFKMTSEFDLNNTLIAMGMPLPFSNEADFSGMTGADGLSISKVVHKAFVDVNEEGTEAAAATAVVIDEAAIEVPQFRADHPFLFVIRDRQTSSVLFIGRVINPLK